MSNEYFTDSIFYEPLTLWLEDLDEISVLLQRQSADVSIQIGKKIYTSYEEFRSDFKGKTIYNMSIMIKSPHISVSFGENQNRLFFHSSNVETMASVFKIDKTLRSRQRNPPLLYDGSAPNLVMIPNMVLLFSMDMRLSRLALGIYVLLGCWWSYIFWARAGRRAIIRIFDKHDQKSIFKEYLPLVAALASAIVAFLLARLF